MLRFQRVSCAIAVAFSLHGQSLSPGVFSQMKWRLIGPFRGGRAVAATGVPGGGTTFLFGSVNGGVWKTTDGGVVWRPIFDGPPVASIGALEVAPSDPNVIYVGTGESDIRSDLSTGDGVYRSQDGGATWTNVGLTETRQISRIVVDPRNPRLVFVGALGHAYQPNDDRGVYRSEDGGSTWKKTLDRGPRVGAADLAIAADQPDVLFAAMWEAHRPPWSTYAPVKGPGSGLFRTTDGGNTWKAVGGSGFPTENLGRIGVAIARGTHGKRIYATVEADRGQSGLYRSDDGGDSWKRVNSDSRVTSRPWYFSSITVDPNDPDIVYVPNVALYKLSEGGKTLSIVRGAPGGDDYHQIWIDPANSQHMALATDQGTTVTLNGGATWSSWYNQPTAQFYHVAVDHDFPYHVYGAQQDSGTAGAASQTDHNQIDLRDWLTVGGSESGYIAPDPADNNIFYVSGTYGSVERFDKRVGQSQNIAPWPVPAGLGKEISQRKYRDPWTPVLVFSPAQPNALYLGTQYVMRTLNGGLHWKKISPDLTGAKEDPPAKSEEPPTVENTIERGYGVVYTIAPSPLLPPLVWAGSDTGLVHVTRDAGQSWKNVTPSGLPPWSKISMIEASHFVAGEALVAVDRHRLDDMRPYLFRTRDFGKTWTPIVSGLPANCFLNAVREDPKRKALLFAGTEYGVFVSFDDGDHWNSLQQNLPVTSIRDLVIHDDDLIVATHGRSFWILDNMSPLREFSATGIADTVKLFAPAKTFRHKSDGFPGTPVPPDEPQASNPVRGAILDYYLPKRQDEVKLEILDSSGKVIRQFSNKDKTPEPPKDRAIAPRWFSEPRTLSSESGMHRFVWDLHYGRSSAEPNEGDDDQGGPPIGPLAVPGVYRVRLRAGERELTQPLQIAMDPRCPATKAELQAQFTWAQRTFESALRAAKLNGEIEGARKQGDFKGSADEMKALLAGDDGLEATSRELSAALNAIESADRVPTSQAIAISEMATKRLQELTTKWTRLRPAGAPAAN